jgi:hypothetical protein
MKIVYIKVTFEDLFSGATMVKTATRSEDTFIKMKKSIGQVVERFEDNIHFSLKVVKVEQI